MFRTGEHSDGVHSARLRGGMAASLTTPIGPGSPTKRLRFNTADKLNVEIFIAGDGEHYPRKGQTVEVHYTAYVSHSASQGARLSGPSS